MDKPSELPDPTDWLDTPLNGFSRLESSLHCQICKDFFTTPMITSCSHTFCSLCIRRCLTEDGICPSCRASDQIIRLRPNCTVQEILDSFLAAREVALKLGKEAKEQDLSHRPPKKRRKVNDSGSEYEDLVEETRQTRASRRRSEQVRLQQSEDERPEEEAPEPLEDGLAECPICSKRMKQELVWKHVETHDAREPVKVSTFPLYAPPSINGS